MVTSFLKSDGRPEPIRQTLLWIVYGYKPLFPQKSGDRSDQTAAQELAASSAKERSVNCPVIEWNGRKFLTE
jgi:hypothetical protein